LFSERNNLRLYSTPLFLATTWCLCPFLAAQVETQSYQLTLPLYSVSLFSSALRLGKEKNTSFNQSILIQCITLTPQNREHIFTHTYFLPSLL